MDALRTRLPPTPSNHIPAPSHGSDACWILGLGSCLRGSCHNSCPIDCLGGKYCNPGIAGYDQHVCKWRIIFNQFINLFSWWKETAVHAHAGTLPRLQKDSSICIYGHNHSQTCPSRLFPLQILVKVCEPHMQGQCFTIPHLGIQIAGTYIY